ncbi:hypothetical protein ABPG72_018049 [Tetrahymena utriculariae]
MTRLPLGSQQQSLSSATLTQNLQGVELPFQPTNTTKLLVVVYKSKGTKNCNPVDVYQYWIFLLPIKNKVEISLAKIFIPMIEYVEPLQKLPSQDQIAETLGCYYC